MASGTTLFERLIPSGQGDRGTGRPAIVASILANLTLLLNARQGQAPAHMDYGVPPFNEIAHDHPASVTRLQTALARCISRYEPRLSNVDVVHIRTGTAEPALHFQISALITGLAERLPLNLETRFDQDGRVRIQG